jgi:outer membrane lipoprotein-sorting protein
MKKRRGLANREANFAWMAPANREASFAWMAPANREASFAWMAPAVVLAGWLLASQVSAADRLDDVLAHMDAVAANFKGVSAQVSFTQVTVVVDDKSTQSGGFYLQRDKKGGYKILIEFREPDEKNILFKDNKAQIYKPKIAQVEEYDVGKEYKDLLNQYLMVGFGGRIDEMKRGYTITLGGDAKILGVNSVKLTLKSKDTANKRQVELWISQDNWLPVQQRSTDLVSKDYLEIAYSNVQPGDPGDKRFDLHIKGKVTWVHPGK